MLCCCIYLLLGCGDFWFEALKLPLSQTVACCVEPLPLSL